MSVSRKDAVRMAVACVTEMLLEFMVCPCAENMQFKWQWPVLLKCYWSSWCVRVQKKCSLDGHGLMS